MGGMEEGEGLWAWWWTGRGRCRVCKAFSGIKSLLMVQVSGELPQMILWHYCATWEWVLSCTEELGGKAWMGTACSSNREKLLVAVQEESPAWG